VGGGVGGTPWQVTLPFPHGASQKWYQAKQSKRHLPFDVTIWLGGKH